GELRACFLNVTSLRAHIGQVRELLSGYHSYDIFRVAETWLGPFVSDDVIQVGRYKVFRQDRNLRGGGVALYIKDNLKCTILASSETQTSNSSGKPEVPEYIFCSVQVGGSEPVLVSVIYRPPAVSFTRNSNLLIDLRNFCSDYSHKIIIGDLNADLLKESSDAKFLSKLSAELSLQLVQHGATHHTPTSHTWIDLILVDDNDTVLDARNLPANFHSRHNLIDVCISCNFMKTDEKIIKYRNYKDICPNLLVQSLAGCDWTPFTVGTVDPESALGCLC
uniref:endonuclease/exonuclease/phosphatase family protein n=1 Tax=Escherichia coli TaxID=562 RepID=UPI0029161788